eukprot:symbB.v1.2.016774.t1/scaffold1201.1/size131815/6
MLSPQIRQIGLPGPQGRPFQDTRIIGRDVCPSLGRSGWKQPSGELVSRIARRNKATRRERLVSLGAAGTMSYLLMKFLKHSVINGIAWYLTAKRTGLPPPRRWKTFLATYAAVYVASTPLQPFKWATIAAMAPGVDRLMTKIASRFEWSKQKAAGLMLFVISMVSASVWMLGVLLACSLAQIPLW